MLFDLHSDLEVHLVPGSKAGSKADLANATCASDPAGVALGQAPLHWQHDPSNEEAAEGMCRCDISDCYDVAKAVHMGTC